MKFQINIKEREKKVLGGFVTSEKGNKHTLYMVRLIYEPK